MNYKMMIMGTLLAGMMQSTWGMEEEVGLPLEKRPSELALSQFALAAKNNAGRIRTDSMSPIEPDNGSTNNEFVSSDKDAQLVAAIVTLRETVCREVTSMWTMLGSFDERLGKIEAILDQNAKSSRARPASPAMIITSVERVQLKDDNS